MKMQIESILPFDEKFNDREIYIDNINSKVGEVQCQKIPIKIIEYLEIVTVLVGKPTL